VQEFVVEGELTMDGVLFERWGYACRPSGEAAGPYATDGGARLLCVWDVDEFHG
jgi:hypothetical protein